MNRSRALLPSLTSLTLLFVAVIAVPTSAATLYDNGPIHGGAIGNGIGAWEICCNAGTVADSFVLNANSTITDFNFGAWVPSMFDYPYSVSWRITTQPFAGTVLGSGNANLANSVFCLNCGYQLRWNIYNSTASGLNLQLPAGTYWLELFNGCDSQFCNQTFRWDENDYPSLAFADSGNGPQQIGSESFQILGTAQPTPEPGSLLLVGSGVLGVTGIFRRKINL